ncbi:SCAN domain-containing protein 3 [Acipenser ruthenus]|uniref:SCAN domain-containing protein 3 n=1 Tax=Acipenser ruthenus TaxID=7906 RepID=A0A444U0U2_ACIRT|nr:SCAN domain-containing protein 3 [Acipenser ruthenus]
MDHVSMLFEGNLDSKLIGCNNLRIKQKEICRIITQDLGPCFHGELVTVLKTRPFSLMLDESSAVAITKLLALSVQFYDGKNIVTTFYALCLVAEQNAESLFNTITTKLIADGIELKNVVGFATDGAIVMTGAHNSVASRFIAANPDIFVSKCICHVLHLCANKGIEELPCQLEDLARDIFTYFCSSKELDKLCEQWDDLTDYFQLLVPEEKLASMERVVKELKNLYYLYYTGLSYWLGKITEANVVLQGNTDLLKSTTNLFYLLHALISAVSPGTPKTADLWQQDVSQMTLTMPQSLYLGIEYMRKEKACLQQGKVIISELNMLKKRFFNMILTTVKTLQTKAANQHLTANELQLLDSSLTNSLERPVSCFALLERFPTICQGKEQQTDDQ